MFLYKKDSNLQYGIGLNPGDNHYRAYVGPPEKYDLVSAMQFNLLVQMGLREYHTMLDIGCGSLRAGRLFLPYLLPEKYYGIEPQKWLVAQGIKNEIGKDMIRIKKPKFRYAEDFSMDKFNVKFDYMIAQSIFSHASPRQINMCLDKVALCLKKDGLLFATFVNGVNNYEGDEWVYPGCVEYCETRMEQFAKDSGMSFKIVDWAHPNGQTWGVFSF